MQLKQLITLAGVVAGQSLTDLVGQNQDLSQLGTLLGQYPDLAQTLGGLSNITVLAPNNAALSALLNDSSVTAAVAADPGLVPASKTKVPLYSRRHVAARTRSQRFSSPNLRFPLLPCVL